MELVSSSRYVTLNSRWTVLVFLEWLKSEGASSAKSGLGLKDEFGTNINGDGQEDITSDIQEGAQSTVSAMVSYVLPTPFMPVHTDMMPHPTALQCEPGLDNEPGPHYESYGSSFGNFGPLPPDSGVSEVHFHLAQHLAV